MYTPSPDRYDRPEGFYQRSGRSGILLPKVSLGLWKNFGSTRDYGTSRDILRHAFDCGITHFDLANNYGPEYGTAEQTFGRVMDEDFRPYRDEMFISTKAGYDMWDGPYGNWGSRKYLHASLDQSLRRMKLDYVDLFYTHRFDPETPITETLQALVDVVRAGKALYVGISRWPLEETAFALQYLRDRDVPCLCFQDCLNLINRKPQTSGIMNLLESEQTGFVSFSPLAQGLLTDRYLDGIPEDSRMRLDFTLPDSRLTPELMSQLQQLRSLARARGEAVATVALRWVLQQSGVTSVIVGASRISQLDDNLRAAEGTPLSAEEIATLEHIFG